MNFPFRLQGSDSRRLQHLLPTQQVAYPETRDQTAPPVKENNLQVQMQSNALPAQSMSILQHGQPAYEGRPQMHQLPIETGLTTCFTGGQAGLRVEHHGVKPGLSFTFGSTQPDY
ncbi:hypothetical protein VMCG_01786 [Cytospora schulzeri]|uniref:Uncharacterized protein n=1 Tax=Cytospora schulzeri TaxID=448051 RepID=A0A423X357_9PEZI|nr:hypothetical protein VMCG_01786 [Valsa malicola]